MSVRLRQCWDMRASRWRIWLLGRRAWLKQHRPEDGWVSLALQVLLLVGIVGALVGLVSGAIMATSAHSERDDNLRWLDDNCRLVSVERAPHWANSVRTRCYDCPDGVRHCE